MNLITGFVNHILLMKSFALLILFNLLLFKVHGQKTFDIPEFKNLNPKDTYPEHSILTTYTTKFDILVSLSGYSNWGPDHNIKVFAYNKSGWYKIELNTDPFYFDKSVRDSIYKINDSIGKIIWDSLIENHLFIMEDERTKKMRCVGKQDTIKHKNGKIEIVETMYDIDDGPEYEFDIITKNNFKKLYFYSPQYYNENCRIVEERTWIINCISIFEKHLGK